MPSDDQTGEDIHKMVHYRLGLHLGVSSLGWVVIDLSEKLPPQAIALRAAGVRIFEPGVEGNVEQGRDSPRGADRRLARLPRRQHWRTQHRKRSLFLWLQETGLLPRTVEYTVDSFGHPRGSLAAERKLELDKLDQHLIAKFLPGAHSASRKTDSSDMGLCDTTSTALFEHRQTEYQLLPYRLRAKAADGERLEPYELGRALYHLVHRRGYKESRRRHRDKNEQGVVHASIALTEKACGDRTFAQYVVQSFGYHAGRFGFVSPDGEFGSANPVDQGTRITKRYTSRDMLLREFQTIRAAQAPLNPQLSSNAWDRIARILFYQRPLKSQRRFVGRCPLEPRRYRSSLALPHYQEFRLLQQVNQLVITPPGEASRTLSLSERTALLHQLSQREELSFSQAIRLLNLPPQTILSVPESGVEADQHLLGHKTNARMVTVFGDRWWQLTTDEQERMVLEVIHYRHTDALRRRASRAWNLSPEAITRLEHVELEEGHALLSRAALLNILPLLREGVSYQTARKQLYPHSGIETPVYSQLPPLQQWTPGLRNPAIVRALTEMRKVVNQLIRTYGRPASVLLELSPELRSPRDRRRAAWRRHQEEHKQWEATRQKIQAQFGRASTADVEKWRLADECHWQCPFTGQPIAPETLVGHQPEFVVAHLYPRRFLDDSFSNKSLCQAAFYRHYVYGRLPADGLAPEQLEATLSRVRSFSGEYAAAKLRRFETRQVAEDYITRQFQDPCYHARLAGNFLRLLYGGQVEADNTSPLIISTGSLSWLLRRAWRLDQAAGELSAPQDHRRHAIAALTTALTTPEQIELLSRMAAAQSSPEARFVALLNQVPYPWSPGFQQNVSQKISLLQVSHRPTRNISGPLHAETNYSRPFPSATGKQAQPQHRVRKSLERLTEKEISGDQIVDPHVRRAVQRKYEELCAASATATERTPARFWGDRQQIERFPVLRKQDGTGSGSLIFSVRLTTDVKPRPVGAGASERQISSGKNSNYALLVYEVLGENGHVIRWTHETVSRFDAHLNLNRHRHAAGERVLIPRTTDEVRDKWKLKRGESIRLLYALRRNDSLLAEGPSGVPTLYRIQSVSESELQLCDHNLPMIAGKARNPWNRITNIDALRKRGARPVTVSLTGEIIDLEPKLAKNGQPETSSTPDITAPDSPMK